MTYFSATASAKINLHLAVTGKRPDGYHTLESLIVFADYGDVLSVTSREDSRFTFDDITGEFSGQIPHNKDNLILQTATLLQKHLNVSHGATITLEKNLPVGAGIGGGSSNAAITALLLCQLWEDELPHGIPSLEELATLLLPLGADIPVCLYQSACFVRGIGEVITPQSLPSALYAVLINPHIPVETASIFRAGFKAFSPSTSENPSFADHASLLQWLETQPNDLMPKAAELVPEIEQILDIFQRDKHCRFSHMSGSGATCFGLYDSLEEAEHARKRILNVHPTWWVVATNLH